jgi:hypothetical protein
MVKCTAICVLCDIVRSAYDKCREICVLCDIVSSAYGKV